jgi:hypothetical protein
MQFVNIQVERREKARAELEKTRAEESIFLKNEIKDRDLLKQRLTDTERTLAERTKSFEQLNHASSIDLLNAQMEKSSLSSKRWAED